MKKINLVIFNKLKMKTKTTINQENKIKKFTYHYARKKNYYAVITTFSS